MRATHCIVGIATLLLGSTNLAAQDQSKVIESADGRTTIVTWGPAPPLPDQGDPDFHHLDTDRNNKLSLSEAEPHRLLHSDFDYADLNDDGQLTPTELARWVN